PVTIFQVRLTSRMLAETVQQYILSAYNIERSLAVFFEDVRGFRQLQRRTGLLISGSFALQFLSRVTYSEADLDLYLPMHGRQEVAAWLQEEGYQFRPSESQAPDAHSVLSGEEHGAANGDYHYPSNGIFAVVSFQKPTTAGERQAVVQLIVAWRTPMEIILGFHSTCVLNVITADTAYAMYPRATFEDMNNLVLVDTTSQTAALAKYVRRGWTLIRELHFPDF
ncbi:hypothetical protein BDW22DRAFT_1298945, partial [Trametopsis cervina]